MEESVIKKLLEELSKANPDHSAIAVLTDTLLDQNPDAVRFSVDAHHIQRLGFELVGKQETALSELIKNAYDADATRVQITFENHHKAGGKLVITDDGVGMDAGIIKKTWMRLSTNEKTQSPVSPKFGRQRAGKKGIGRFAVQRLGKKLTLETEVEGESVGLRVHFEWDNEYKAGRNLHDIWNKIETYEKDITHSGTKLIINDLRDRWSDATIDRVWKSVLLLQPPHKLSKERRVTNKSGKVYKPDPGFTILINGKSAGQTTELSIEKSFLDHAIAIISGSIDKDGTAIFRLQSEKLALDDKYTPETQYLLTGPVTLESRYFIYLSDVMPGLSVRTAMEMGNKFGGIRIYRDGFRVMPYGETYDDWLRLGRDTGRRNLLVPANNYNFFGQVEINRTENPLLEETSGREGLIENEAYDELRKFTRQCVEWAAKRVASARERKQTASQKDFISVVRKPSEAIGKVIENLEEEIGKTSLPQNTEKTRKAFSDLKEIAQSYEYNQEKAIEKHIKYEAMLRILASLGLSIAVPRFTFQVQQFLTNPL